MRRDPLPLDMCGATRRGHEHGHRQMHRVQIEACFSVVVRGCPLPGPVREQSQNVRSLKRRLVLTHRDDDSRRPGVSLRSRHREAKFRVVDETEMRFLPGKRFRLPPDDGNSVTAPLHEIASAFGAFCPAGVHPGKHRSKHSVPRGLALCHAVDGQIVGKGARRAEFQPVRVDGKTYTAAADRVVAMHDRVHHSFEQRPHTVLWQVFTGRILARSDTHVAFHE